MAQERTNAQLYSHMTRAGNRTRATVVRGERLTHYATHATQITGPDTQTIIINAGQDVLATIAH